MARQCLFRTLCGCRRRHLQISIEASLLIWHISGRDRDGPLSDREARRLLAPILGALDDGTGGQAR